MDNIYLLLLTALAGLTFLVVGYATFAFARYTNTRSADAVSSLETYVQFATQSGSAEQVDKTANASWAMVEELVYGYHAQALQQAKIQFWFSALAASVGFVLISSMTFGSEAKGIEMFYRSTPGLVVEAVAALFFRQAAATRERATALYDRLRTDSQALRSIDLVETIENEDIRSGVKAQLSLHLAGLTPKEIDMTKLLERAIDSGSDGNITAE